MMLAGLRHQLDDTGVGQALYLMTGLPPFTRVRDLRARNRGDLMLDPEIQVAKQQSASSHVARPGVTKLDYQITEIRREKLLEAKTKFEERVQSKRMDEVAEDYHNLVLCLIGAT